MKINTNLKYSYLFAAIIAISIGIANCQEKISIKLNKNQPLNKQQLFQNLKTLKFNILPHTVQQFQTNKQKPKIQKLNINSKHEEIHQTIDRSYQYLKEVMPLKNYLDVQYTGTIGVGKNKQQFTVLFDSGSNQLWVPQNTCESCGFSTNRYDCSQNTCQETTDEIRYGKGYVKGQNSNDLVTIGKSQTMFPFLSIFTSEDLEGFQSDGILGLGVNKSDSIVNKLFQEKKVEMNLFSFKLTKALDEKGQLNNDESQLIIGGIDDEIVSNEKDVNYFKVISSYYWAISMDSASYGKNSLFKKNKDVRVALIDSGTSLIHMPSQDFKALNKTIIESNRNQCVNMFDLIVCFCEEKNINNLPPIKISLTDMNNQDYTINILPKNYILYDSGFCVYMIQEFPDIGIDNMWILGDVFMRQTYNIFNYEKRAIGIVDMEQSKSSSLGGFVKFVFIIIVLVMLVFLAKFIYQNYINKPQSHSQSQQQQQYQQQQDIPLQPLNEQLL